MSQPRGIVGHTPRNRSQGIPGQPSVPGSALVKRLGRTPLGARRHRAVGCARVPEGDRGSGTVIVLALAGVLVIAMGAVVAFGAAVLAKTRAQTAADLAALAGAQAVLDHRGIAVACAQAQDVARAHGTRLVACSAHESGRCEVVVARAIRPPVSGRPGAQPDDQFGPAPRGAAAARAVAGRPP
jgi:secretion/DNA translocation related TadE-like protein